MATASLGRAPGSSSLVGRELTATPDNARISALNFLTVVAPLLLIAVFVQVLEDNTALHSGGFIDSVSVMVLIDFLEASFGIEFEPHEVDADNLDSLELMTAFVQSKL